MPTSRLIAPVVFVALAALTSQATAQPLPQSTSVAVLADSIALAGDTARAYAMLDSAVRANRNDAAAWHQFGVLNWRMSQGKRSGGFIRDQKVIKRLMIADSALHIATQLAPDSARFWLSLGRYNLTSGVATMRFAASGQVSNALEAARRINDPFLISAAADEVGMAAWRRYETIANRGLLGDGRSRLQMDQVNALSRAQAKDLLDSYVKKIEPPTGENDYKDAIENFEVAVKADPTSQRSSRHLYMAYAERGNWRELLTVADRRAKEFPLDHQAQLARGLALHRIGDERASQIAFDSAQALMDDTERARLTRFTRILRPAPLKSGKPTMGDTLAFVKLPEDQRRGLEAMYWLMSDPLTFTNENEYKLEFLSRVVFADFRWTNEEMGMLGADSDRGDLYIRYGPPDRQVTILGATGFQGEYTDGGVTLVWAYQSGLVFFFDMMPGFGTAKVAFDDKANVDQLKNQVPVSWENVKAATLTDTIPIRIARFRVGADSADAVVTASIPVDSLVRGLETTANPVDIDFRIYDQFVRMKGVESEQRSVRGDSSATPIPRAWRRRLGPGINVVRVEALQADSRRSARAMVRLDPEPGTGFGMSDLLLGDKPALRDGVAPRRWNDVTMEPGLGVYRRGTPIGLLWEVYDLVARDGASKYKVEVSVQRTDRSPLGRIAGRVFDGLGRTVGREQVSRDKLTIAFDRTAAAAPMLVEFLSLDLAEASAGEYRLRVDITDLANNRRTARETSFRIR